MGITNLIHGDLSGFAEGHNVSFDDIIHKAVVEIDEEGTTAAGATGSIGRGGDEPLSFVCDHPFIFTINDRRTQEVLFIGVFRGPN